MIFTTHLGTDHLAALNSLLASLIDCPGHPEKGLNKIPFHTPPIGVDHAYRELRIHLPRKCHFENDSQGDGSPSICNNPHTSI